MHAYGPSSMGVILLVMTQLLGPSFLWAADSSRGGKGENPRRAVVSGLRGEVLVTPADTTKEPKPVRFHEVVNAGDQLTTGAGSLIEVLVGRHALVTLHEDSSFQLIEETSGQVAVQLTKGEVRLAVARTEEVMTVHTPTATAVTRGGLVRVKVVPAKRQASHRWEDGEAHPIAIAFGRSIPVATGPGSTGQLETYQVSEGTVQVKPSSSGAPTVNLEAGQNLQVIAGQASKPSTVPSAPGEKYPLPAAELHARTSEAGVKHLAAQQQKQAEALQQVLLGPTDIERPLARNAATGAIISTTGVIISTTGSALTQSQNQGTPASFFAPGAIFSAATLTNSNRPATGLADDNNTNLGDIKYEMGTPNGKTFTVQGGGGLLVFDKHTIQATSELLIVDGGARQLAPHGGVPPSSTVFVTPSPLLSPAPSVTSPRLDTGLPLQITGVRSGSGAVAQNINTNAEVFVASSQPAIDLQQYSRENAGVPGGLSGQNIYINSSTSDSLLVVRTTVNVQGNFAGFANPTLPTVLPTQRERSIVDGVVRARSDVTGDRTVTLTGGVILNSTKLIAAFNQAPLSEPALPSALQPPANATQQYFNETGQSAVVNGSIIGIIAKNDSNRTLRPAFAALQDRVLAVLNGSSIGPPPNALATKISLLSVLDSQLVGPTTVPSTRVGQNGQPGVPPLLEIINSNPPLSNPAVPGVQVTSAIVIRATGALNGILPVDRGLLEASSPLLAMVNSTMTTTSHFADLSGAGPANSKGLLTANLVPGDALIRLDASRLTVMGNLFNLTNGATASVTGHLFSLTNSSSLTVNGVLVNLAGNSVLNLTSTAFGVFGAGANTLTISNNGCAGGCTTIPGFPGLRVSGGGTVTLPAGFTPFALAPGAPVPQVNIAPNAAVFQVSPQAHFNITTRH